MTEARKRVGLLFGGRSAEHEVSKLSAANVLRALDPDLYEVISIGINRDGRWLLCEGNNHVGTGPSLMLVAKSELAFRSHARRLNEPAFNEVSGLTNGCRERLVGRVADFATSITVGSGPCSLAYRIPLFQ